VRSPDTEPDGSPGLHRDPPKLGAEPGEAMSARGCVSVPCDGRRGRDAAKDVAEGAEASARNTAAGEKGGVSSLMCCFLVVEQIFPCKRTKPSK